MLSYLYRFIGVGKTSLIKSIVQTCEDIVHVDPLSPNPPSIDQLPSRKINGKSGSTNLKSTNKITEVYASTKPYPTWWSDIDETKIFRRRKSIGDTVLERNLCFVDTPGYSHGISRLESIDSILQYIEMQFTKPFADASGNQGDFVSLLSGSGGSQVDVVLYMIAQGMSSKLFFDQMAADCCYRSHRRSYHLSSTSSGTNECHSSNRKIRLTISRRD